MAHIEKRGDSYRITVSNGFAVDGKRIYEKITFHPTKTTPAAIEKEVAAFAHDFEKAVKEGKYLSGEKITFSDLTAHWYAEWAVHNLTEGTADTYLHIIKTKAFPAFGNMKISRITPLNIQKLMNEIYSGGCKVGTVRKNLVAINSVFRYAYRLGIITDNPCNRCTAPKEVKESRLNYFTTEEAKRFLRAIREPYRDVYKSHDRIDDTGKGYHVAEYTETRTMPLQLQTFFYLAVYGGFRRGEIIALRWSDIDFNKNTVSVSRAAAVVKGSQIIKDPKTVAGIREVMLPEVCFSMLSEWKTEQMRLSLQLGSEWCGKRGKAYDDNYIFIQPGNGKMMHLDTPYNAFKRFIHRYNATCSHDDRLPEIRLHDLRHTSATLLLAEGADIETVSRRLGHSKASVTLDVYGHPLPEKDEQAAALLGEMLS